MSGTLISIDGRDKSVVEVDQAVQHPVLWIPDIIGGGGVAIGQTVQHGTATTEGGTACAGREGAVRRCDSQVCGDAVRWRS